ncbi:MAG: glycosyltransferase [Opitutaceae bacterium]
MDDGREDRRTAPTPERATAVSTSEAKVVHFCTNVGGGVFGEGQVAAWRECGLDARLHYAVELADYWRAKSGMLSKLRLRWVMYLHYPRMLRQAVRAARPGEVFVAVTNPFFAPALAAREARRSGARIVHLVYDLYPDALVFGGGWSPGHPAARFAASTTRAAIRNCAATVYLGERLRAHAEAQYGAAKRTAVIAVGTDASVFADHMPELRNPGSVHCLYSGHMGRLHDWETLAGALAEGISSGCTVEIAADGPGARQLKDALRGVSGSESARLRFAGTRGNAEWRAAMLAADVALVTMCPGAEKVVMPSKTYSAMAAGQAILAVCPRNSDLADTVLRHDCGWIVEPGDAGDLRHRLAAFTADRGELLRKRRNAYTAAHSQYSMRATAQDWKTLLGSL